MSELAGSASEFPFNISLNRPSDEADGGAMEQNRFDRPTFDRLVVEHMDGALRFAIRLCGDASAAEDLMQDALLRAHRGWRTFRGEAKFRTWLYQIIINCFRDRLAAGLRPAREMPEDLEDTAARPGDIAQARELAELVATEVSRLPPRQREVLVLSFYEKLSNSEIAAALAINEQNVRTTLHLARERLRQRLDRFLK